jgi:radical SAM superfamily enzyme YgiQ (UPF0313 family)
MDILFIYTNINGTHEETYAIGLASIVAISKKEGHNVKVIIVKNREDYSKIFKEISIFNPRIVAFTAVSSQFNFVIEISEVVKKVKSDIITVCGGVHPTIFPECVLDAPYLDGIFRGESEYSFVEFLQKVDQNKSFKDTDNFCYTDNGSVLCNPLKPFIEDLDSLPFPDKTSYPYIETVSQYGIAPFLFSRGCPFSCSYCSNHAIAKAYNRDHNTTDIEVRNQVSGKLKKPLEISR